MYRITHTVQQLCLTLLLCNFFIKVSDFYGLGLGLDLLVSVSASASASVKNLQVLVSVLVSNFWVSTTTLLVYDHLEPLNF